MEMFQYWFTQITMTIILIVTYFLASVIFLLVAAIYLLTTLVAVVHQLQLLRREIRWGKK